MLHIVLTILKIIGIILLVIIGLVLLICACILFVPIRYRIQVTYKDEFRLQARVTYLLHAVCAKYVREHGEGDMELKLFGIRTHFFDKEKKKEAEAFEEDTKMFEDMARKMHETDKEELPEPVIIEDNIFRKEEEEVKSIDGKNSEKVNAENENSVQNPADEEAEKKENDDSDEHISFFGKIKNKIKKIFQKIKYRFKAICGTIKKIYKNITDAKEFLSDEKTKNAISFVKGEAGKLIRHIRPRKIKGYLNFGFDDPSQTGKVLGLIYMFSRGTSKNFQINPDFENKVLEGDMQLKGRIQVYYLLIIAYNLYKDKNFREVLDVLERRRTNGRK
ncbi:MAG: DUF2953 domain-containing protein [Lachnospiraceae bacterium]|nr:DUF2953 domain-containing protein [Lachnospiraceae bacterium]